MRIGIDLGGTKIEGVVMDTHGEIVARQRIPSPASYTGVLGAIGQLVQDLENTAQTQGLAIGIGHPGAISHVSGLIKNANSTQLNGQKLDHDLERLLGRPVAMANDANCFALSEARDGAGAGLPVVFGVILGTGVGGGVIIDGKPLNGLQSIAGEWGHNPLPSPSLAEMPGPACYCGKQGCNEVWLSGPGFQAWSGQPPREANAQSLALYADRLARGLANVVNILDPDIIVLGGGLSNIDALYPLVNAALPAYVFSDACATRVVKHHHGDSSGVRGAAWLNDINSAHPAA